MNIHASEREWNTIHGKEWKRVSKIGSGAYGSVFIGQRVEDKMVFAVKSTPWPVLSSSRYQTPSREFSVLQNEITTLSQIRCKHIIRMLGCGQSNGLNSFRQNESAMLDLFLEYIPRGSLQHLMRRLTSPQDSNIMTSLSSTSTSSSYTSGSSNSFSPARRQPTKGLPEDYVRAYTADILLAVDYLHRKQFVHGDIKPLNLLLDDDCLKLADFGGCKTLKKKTIDSVEIHTSRYSAPEVYYGVEQGFASDIFSVGCTVLEMIIGSVPEPLFIPQSLSPEGQNFLRRCITGDPFKRWTAAQLLDHPFIRDRDQNDTRPYSTVIPQGAESMIVQPPPIEFYTNTMLSPTYRGTTAFRGPTDAQKMNWRLYGKHFILKGFRRENIKISSQPNKQTKDKVDNRSVLPTAISHPTVPVPVAAGNATPPTKNPVSKAQIVAEAPALIPKPDQDESLHSPAVSPLPSAATPAHAASPTSNPASRAALASHLIPIPPATAAVTDKSVGTKSNPGFRPQIRDQDQMLVDSNFCFPRVGSKRSRSKSTSQNPSAKKQERPLKSSPRPEDPEHTQSSAKIASATNSSVHKVKEIHSNDVNRVALILPEYKPEFVPPDDQTLHFLLPVAPKKEKQKYDDLDARVDELMKDSPNSVNRKPPPLLRPAVAPPDSSSTAPSGSQHKPSQQVTETSVEELQRAFPKIREYNEEIKAEARMAEAAGIYDNKLCPGAGTEESSRPTGSPSQTGRSGNPSFLDSLRSLAGCSRDTYTQDSVVTLQNPPAKRKVKP